MMKISKTNIFYRYFNFLNEGRGLVTSNGPYHKGYRQLDACIFFNTIFFGTMRIIINFLIYFSSGAVIYLGVENLSVGENGGWYYLSGLFICLVVVFAISIFLVGISFLFGKMGNFFRDVKEMKGISAQHKKFKDKFCSIIEVE